MHRLSLALVLVFSSTFSSVAQNTRKPSVPETGYANCHFRMFGFYLDMPEPEALRRVPTMQLYNEGYEHVYTAQVSFPVSSPKYPLVDQLTLEFRHGRVLNIRARLATSLEMYSINDLARWVMRQYGLPDEWEVSTAVQDVADNGIVRGARTLHYRGANFYVSNTKRVPYFSLDYR